jgi:hypothetical protein
VQHAHLFYTDPPSDLDAVANASADSNAKPYAIYRKFTHRRDTRRS